MYENTGPRAHEMAAELIDGGRRRRTRSTATSTRASRRASSSCWRAGSTNVERFDDGLLTVTHLTPRRLRAPPAPTRATPRASSTTCARSRAPRSPGSCATSCRTARRARKVSLRATDDRVDVSAIARAQGGGGHRRAAGFSTDAGVPELVEVPARRALPRSSLSRPTGSSLFDKPAGDHVARRRRAGAAAAAARASRSGTRARSTRSRPGCCSCWSAARRACSAS